MAYFNQEYRPATYNFACQAKCFDCTSFRWFVGKYLMTAGVTQTSHDGPAIDARCLRIETTTLRNFRDQGDRMRMRSGLSVYLHDGEEEDIKTRSNMPIQIRLCLVLIPRTYCNTSRTLPAEHVPTIGTALPRLPPTNEMNGIYS